MSKACCVCRDSKETPENRLFTCQGHGCDVTVHQGCYGIVTVPTGLWFCRKCESQERAARVRCELCPRKEGALKRTDSGGWAHVVCALYIPEVTFGNNRRMEPIVTTKLPRERFSKSCYVCEEQGLETQATYGACMSCHKSSCRMAFHVTCAQKEHLLCEEEDQRDPRNIVYCGYCSTHYKKMMKQKFKSNLRKQVMNTPTSSSAPPFPPMPTSPSFVTSPTSTSHPSTLPGLTPSQTIGGMSVSHEVPLPSHGAVAKGPSTTGKHPKHRDKPSMPSSSTTSGGAPSTTKRLSSTDQPLPPAKRKKRSRKLSSSNESSTSEAPSNSSELLSLMAAAGTANSSSSPPVGLRHQLVASPLLHGGSGGGGVGKGHQKHHESLVVVDSGGAGVEGRGTTGDLLLGGGVAPFSPTSLAQVALEAPPSSSGGQLVAGSSTGSDHHNRSQPLAPPRSLQELLERQWEQTAKFILHQAGKQNNAGSMLAHLHTLQSENRGMQSRIMELASKREFYIAINTKLRQTLTDHDLVRLPNGVQQVGTTLDVPQQASSSTSTSLTLTEAVTHKEDDISRAPVVSGASEEGGRERVSVGVGEHQDRMIVMSSTIPKEAQDSLLQAHFSSSSLPTTTQQQQHSTATAGDLSSTLDPSSHPHTFTPHSSQHHNSHSLLSESEATSLYDITQVTNSVQAPITAFTPLPNDTGVLLMGGDNHHGDGNHRDTPNALYSGNYSSSATS